MMVLDPWTREYDTDVPFALPLF
jgi:hypothetical protein